MLGRVFKAYGSVESMKSLDVKGHIESVGLRLAEEAHGGGGSSESY